jgi:hypothetical protein
MMGDRVQAAVPACMHTCMHACRMSAANQQQKLLPQLHSIHQQGDPITIITIASTS